MEKMLETYISNLNLESKTSNILENLAKSIPANTVPYKMKLGIAVSELMLFVSQFRINIRIWDRTLVPTNALTFVIAKSGASKDSSVRACRNCFTDGYKLINSIRLENTVTNAIANAVKEGEEETTTYAVYRKYLKPLNPLFAAPSTSEGFIQHLNDLSEVSLGAGYMFSGEIGSELSTSTTLADNIKLLAELYDQGTKEAKILKDRNAQSREIANFPVSALFMGSPDNIVGDEHIKRKFKTDFSTKLARRSFFIFVAEDVEKGNYDSIEELLQVRKDTEVLALQHRDKMVKYLIPITKNLLDRVGTELNYTDDVFNLYNLYKEYNEYKANAVSTIYPLTKLTRAHMQWKTLKLSGALALIKSKNIIEKEDYVEAMNYVESICTDIQSFEKELLKEPYEAFAQYLHSVHVGTDITLSIHDLKKMGYIAAKGTTTVKLKELHQLVSSYDTDAVYSLTDGGITFKKLDKTDKINLSVLPSEGTKEERVKTCANGYTLYDDLTFRSLLTLFKGNYAYCSFLYTDGIRNNSNVGKECKWIVFDIDKKHITDKEAHMLLEGINHIICRTSDPNNPFKFRVLIELDAVISIDISSWVSFMQTVSTDLGFIIDRVGKAQAWLTYIESAHTVLSVLDAEPLPVKPYLIAFNKLPKKGTVPLTTVQKNSLLNNTYTTFERAFRADKGERSCKLIWAARHAQSLGADVEYITNLVWEINSYWVLPMNKIRIEDTILSQVKRWFK